MKGVHRAGPSLAVLALLGGLCIAPADLGAQSGLNCAACHGELELLRQHTPTLEEAQLLHVPQSVIGSSAHAGMACTQCHSGFRRYPHDGGDTEGCADCHADQRMLWSDGIHALDGNADCTACHGIHDVLTTDQLHEPVGIAAIQVACGSCHFEPRTPPDDPHAQSESCSACHEPHRTLAAANPLASVHPLNQQATCGKCHDAVAAAWLGDVHGEAVPRLASEEDHRALDDLGAHLEPPACTGCHGAHGMLTPSSAGFPSEMATRCSHCHEEYAESFADSYHGQATELGSEEVASCYDCHGAHAIQPSTNPASMVSEANLLATCQTCHPDATPGFALFQPHADHNDRENYPFVYWSYHLMTLLLIGVFTVFGAHTALWVLRLGIGALRGESGHEPPAGD